MWLRRLSCRLFESAMNLTSFYWLGRSTSFFPTISNNSTFSGALLRCSPLLVGGTVDRTLIPRKVISALAIFDSVFAYLTNCLHLKDARSYWCQKQNKTTWIERLNLLNLNGRSNWISNNFKINSKSVHMLGFIFRNPFICAEVPDCLIRWISFCASFKKIDTIIKVLSRCHDEFEF